MKILKGKCMSQGIIKFKNYSCNIELGRYNNERLAIKLISAVNDMKNELFLGSPIATATVNVPEIKIDNNQIIIKSYMENDGMLETLEQYGYIKKFKKVNIGFVDVYVCDKSKKLKELENSWFNTKENIKKLKP